MGKTKPEKCNVWLILIMILTSVFNYSCHHIPTENASSDKYRLVWNDDPATTVTIAWDQLKGNNPVVLYGRSDYERKYWKYKQKQAVSSVRIKYNMNTHFAKLTGLSPGQNYYFVIKDSSGVSKRYWFKTAPDKPEAFTFIAGGDTKSEEGPLEAGRASNRMVAKLRPLFILFNGDFCSGDGTNPDYWKQWLTDWFTLTTTADGRMFPIVPVHGNHENGDLKNLFYIFNTPFQNGDTSNIFYSLSLGGNFMHITALNTEIDEGGVQRQWLEEDLRNHESYIFKIAGYHRPFRSHCSTEPFQEYETQQWAGLFYKYGLNVAFVADAHICSITYPLRPDSTGHLGFSRDDENGTMFVGEGSWGANPRSNDHDKPWTILSGSYNQFKWIHVFPKNDNETAKMKIFIAINGTYDNDNKQTLYDADVVSLSETDLFKIPENIHLQKFPDGKYFVSYPISRYKSRK